MHSLTRPQVIEAKNVRFALMCILSVVIFALFLILRLDNQREMHTGDDLIPVVLSESMSQHGDLDANWRLADNMPAEFRYDQYNFYSYNLFCHGILTLLRTKNPYITLKAFNIFLQALAILMIMVAAKASKLHDFGKYSVAIILSVLPCMVQDARMVRPESFIYFLLSGIILTASTLRGARLYAISGLLVGIAMASKITCAAFILVVLPQMWRDHRDSHISLMAGLLVLLAALAIGFALGAPYAVVHMDVYRNGLQILNNQYDGQPPWSEPSFSLLANANKIVLFILLLYGPFLLLSLSRTVREAPPWVLGLAAMGFVLIAFFSTKPVFFERNISAGLVGLSVAACFCIQKRLGQITISASICIMTYWSAQIAVANTRFERRFHRWELANVGPIKPEWPSEEPTLPTPSCSGTVGIRDYGDGLSKQILQSFLDAGAVPLARYSSVFHHLPTSTLQVYLDSDVQFFRCK